MQSKYFVREDLKKALPGPYYQVLVALNNILNALQTGQRFNIMLELSGVGALDDIVFSYVNEFRYPTYTFYLQLKHSSDNSETLNEGDFKNKSGKCELFKYFDDWCLFLRGQQNIKCIYYTNRDLNNAMKASGNFVLANGGYSFSSSFFAGTYNKLYENIVEMIKKNSIMCNKKRIESKSVTTQKLNKNPTYKAAKEFYERGGRALTSVEANTAILEFLKDHYCIMAGQQHVEQLEKTVAEQIARRFSQHADAQSIFNALIVETWQWFRTLGEADVWTETNVEAKLREFETRYLAIPQQIGSSLTELGMQLSNINPLVERPQLSSTLKTVLTGQDQTVVFTGEAKAGKSTAIAKYLLHESQFKSGEYLFYALPSRFFSEYESLLNIDCVKLFIVDGVENSSHELIKAISTIRLSRKRLVVFSRVAIEGILPIPIFLLSKDEINAFLIKQNKATHELMIGDKKFCLSDIVNMGEGGLYHQMRFPFRLKELSELAKPPTLLEDNSHSVIASPYHSCVQRNFRPVELNVDRVMPLYTFENIIKFNEFKGSKCVIYQTNDQLHEFKNRYGNTESHVWLEIDSISLIGDPNLKANLNQLLIDQFGDKQKKRFENGILVLCIVDKEEKLKQWSMDNVRSLFQIPNLIIFSPQVFEKPVHSFYLLKQSNEYLLEYRTDNPCGLPLSNAKINRPSTTSLLHTLEQDQSSAKSSVIMSVGGSGKSTALKMLYNKHCRSKNFLWANYYHHIVYVPFGRLVNLNLKSLIEIAKYFLSITDENITHALRFDLDHERVLFLLDGWDELNYTERSKLNELLSLFSKYKHFILTTRPVTNMEQLFFTPSATYQLQQLNTQQIREFFTTFFNNESHPDITSRFIEQGIQYLENPENKSALKMIGLPLQCYMLCETWREAFELRCLNIEISLPWEEIPVLNHLQLYQQYVVSRLRKTLFDQYAISKTSALTSPEEICTLGNRHLLILQEAAYQQLFRGKSISLGKDWFSQQIERMGLIGDQEFEHKTYAEYFSALYLINLLINDPNSARQLIIKYRYQALFHPVFEFMAGIVTHGDPIIPMSRACLKAFWGALLQRPRDRIGIVDGNLIKVCIRSSNKEILNSIFSETEIPSALNIASMTQPVTPSLSQNEDLPSKTKTVNKANVAFTAPLQPYSYSESASNISNLPTEHYDSIEKIKALKWLLSRIQSSSGFTVRKACLIKISELGIANDEVINVLINIFGEAHSDRSVAKETVVKVLIELEVELPRLNLTPEYFKIFIQNFFKLSLSQTQCNWFNRQRFLESQFNDLLLELSRASLAVQQTILAILANTHKELFIQKAHADINRYNNNWYFIICCFKHELLKLGCISEDDYFRYIFQLRYNENTFPVIILLLEPASVLLNEKSAALKYTQSWVKILYEFAMEAIKEHKFKDSMSQLILMLAQLRIDRSRVENILEMLLARSADYGFWDTDAVFPCLQRLSNYFGLAFAEYLFYKSCFAKYPIQIANFSQYINVDDMLDDDARICLIKACLRIHHHCYSYNKNGYSNSRDSSNPAYHIQNCSVNLVCNVILAGLNEAGVLFLQNYLAIAGYALTILPDKIEIYTPSGVIGIPINDDQHNLLVTMPTEQPLFFSESTFVTTPRPSSPTTFLIEYPGTLLFNKPTLIKNPAPKNTGLTLTAAALDADKNLSK